MTPRSKIRLAREHDLKELVRLEEAAFESDRFRPDQIEYLITRSRATVLVMSQSSTLVGAAYLLWRKSHQSARLYNIAVDPAHQGQGLGRKLIKECEIEAARRDCRRIFLEVRQDNESAIRFYERRGYVFVKNLPDYYATGVAGIKMAKDLRLRTPPKIQFRVPYYAQTLDFTCGPACLMMALKYFKPQQEFSRALEMSLWKEATSIFMTSGFGGTDGYGLGLAAVLRGLNCWLVISTDRTPMLRSVRIPQRREVMRIVHKDMKLKARRAGVTGATFEYNIDDIVAAIHRGLLPVAMISTYRLTGDRVPHWIVITGCDEKYIFIHDPDVQSYRKNKSRARHRRVEKSEFLKMSRYGQEAYRCLLLFGSK